MIDVSSRCPAEIEMGVVVEYGLTDRFIEFGLYFKAGIDEGIICFFVILKYDGEVASGLVVEEIGVVIAFLEESFSSDQFWVMG